MMGNETSILKKCNVSCKSEFQTKQWSLFDAKHENQSFSVFIIQNNDYCYDFMKWKHIRHPYLVKFYESGIYKNKKYILTEPVIPLRQIFEHYHRFLRLSGLYNIGEAITFLHQICHISLNNLSIDSIFISKNDPNELWKIGSLYWCSTIESETVDFFENLLNFHKQNASLEILPPEIRQIDNQSNHLIKSTNDIHQRDIYSFVILIQELFYDVSNNVQPKSDPNNHNFMAKKLLENFFQSKPSERPSSIQSILEDPLFKNCPFVQLRQFLSNFSQYNDREKFNFLENLIENLQKFPDQSLVVNIFTMIVSSRFIMSNRLVYNNVMPYFLIPLSSLSLKNDENSPNQQYLLTNGETITLKPFINEQIYRKSIIPHLMKLYCVHDYKIRILLLKYLPHYGRCVSKQCLKKILLPQILLGIKDLDKELVSLTFRSIATLIDLFGVCDVLGGGMNRIRYFSTNVSDNNNGENDSIKSMDNNASVGRRNSFDSTKSSSIFDDNDDHHQKLVIFERSSPDGGETISNENINSNKFPLSGSRVNNLQYGDDDDDEEWPGWEPNEQLTIQPQQSTLMTSNNKSDSVKLMKKVKKLEENFKTFDIKEIDFNHVNHSKEIDNLFMDMAPVVNFNHRNSHLDSKTPIKNDAMKKESEPSIGSDDDDLQQSIRIDSSIFADKNDFDQNHIGWNDDDGGGGGCFDWNDDLNGTVNDNNNNDDNDGEKDDTKDNQTTDVVK
ncbi:protein-associating with the carboxyl-terminal domain of ezrin [Dermatophagoides pteronyssinus]|uniref:protein-associating with the carboxyl-terminal domain of ezrin n=1 Tax=Dermatophagoides pteronyssinus TaxID=6956 RepID=UPI003F679C67